MEKVVRHGQSSDRMGQEAEKYRADDESDKQKIEASNGLENCITMRNTAEDESSKQKIEANNGLENYCFTMRNTLLS